MIEIEQNVPFSMAELGGHCLKRWKTAPGKNEIPLNHAETSMEGLQKLLLSFNNDKEWTFSIGTWEAFDRALRKRGRYM